MKKSTTFLFILFSFVAMSQPPVIMRHSGSVATPYYSNDLTQVINNAINGDTIYLSGGEFFIEDSSTISKKIYLIGAGHHPDSTLATGRSVISSTGPENTAILFLEGGVSGSYFTGVYFNVYNLVFKNEPIEEVAFHRCAFNQVLLSENAINGSLSQNIEFRECNGFGYLWGGRAKNILIENSYWDAPVLYLKKSIIKNSILGGGVAQVDSCDLGYNVIAGNDLLVKNSHFVLSIFTASFNFPTTLNGNTGHPFEMLTGLSFGEIFTDPSPASVYERDMHLNSNNQTLAPFINSNGKDQAGIYSGATPYQVVPDNPHIFQKNIASNTNPDGSLSVGFGVLGNRELHTVNPIPCKITAYEYWTDNNYNNKTFMDVAPTTGGVFSMMENINLNGPDTGQHIFHIRFKDDCGQWSSVCSDYFKAPHLPDTTVVFVETCDIQLLSDVCDTEVLIGQGGIDSIVMTCYEWLPINTMIKTVYTCDSSQVGSFAAPYEHSPNCYGLEITHRMLPPLNFAPTLEGPQVACLNDAAYFSFEDVNEELNIGYVWQLENADSQEVIFTEQPEYSWSFQEVGVFYLSAATINGCGDTSSFSMPLEIGVAPLPTVNPLPNDMLQVCEGDLLAHDFGDFPHCLITDVMGTVFFGCELSLIGEAELSGNYYLYVTDDIGCETTYPFVIDVKNHPPLLLGQPDYVCDGDTLLLCPMTTGSDSLSYQWTTGDTATCIGVASPNTYGLTVTDGFGCSSSDSVYVPFYAPFETMIGESGCELSVEHSIGQQYVWVFDSVIINGANQPNYIPMGNGIYHVIVTNIDGCTATDSIEVDCFVNDSEAQWLKGFRLFPNPNDGEFFIELNTHIFSGEINLEIFNPLGEKVFFEKAFFKDNYFSKKINMGNMASGIYFLKMEMNGDGVLRKFVLD